MCVCVYVCVCMCVFACVCVCVYIYLNIIGFIDPFNNPIIKFKVLCLKRVNMFDTCGDVMPFCLLIFRSDNPLLKSDYHIS